MQRSYIVIPEGTPVLRVSASSPHFAASKARRGKAEHSSGGPLVFPASASASPHDPPRVIPGQLALEEALLGEQE